MWIFSLYLQAAFFLVLEVVEYVSLISNLKLDQSYLIKHFHIELWQKTKDTSSSDKCRDEPLVEAVHDFEVHVVGGPHLLVHQIQRSVGNELVQMSVVISLQQKHRNKSNVVIQLNE